MLDEVTYLSQEKSVTIVVPGYACPCRSAFGRIHATDWATGDSAPDPRCSNGPRDNGCQTRYLALRLRKRHIAPSTSRTTVAGSGMTRSA